MYSIGQISKKFNLSRSTLLYYDSIGLLEPSSRTSSNYRMYSDKDINRLEQIILYREAGVSLEDIQLILDNPHTVTGEILEKRLYALHSEIKALQLQQQIIIQMLKDQHIPEDIHPINKDTFVKILKNAGLGDPEMARLHMEFETSYPEQHQAFLEFLGISPDEIRLIRKYSKKKPVL